MHDRIIRAATVIDGSGAAPRTLDVAITDGRISAVGRITEAARETLDASGAWLTPGFIDIHSHYDGQASWDETFSPSVLHGTSTVILGNCGVGFAPLADNTPAEQQRLVQLMEGVEDIPGAALAEGVRFNWTDFPSYMAALDALPHTLDFACLVPHDPLRMSVMRERALADQAATADDIAAMRRALRRALEAGAIGFSTGRSDNHRTALGQPTPASEATQAELEGIAQAFDGWPRGVVQLVNDFDVLRGAPGDEAAARARFDAEFALVRRLAAASGRPTSLTWMQRDPGGAQWLWLRDAAAQAAAEGLPLYLQTAARGIGVILGLDTAFHPLMGFPLYKEIAHLPLAERAAALRDPARRARLDSETSTRQAGDGSAVPPLVDILLARFELISARIFPLNDPPDYALPVQASMAAQARARGVSALRAVYDYLAEGNGERLLYFPIFNYNDGNLDVVGQMLRHPRALLGLSDAGAHVGTICDASFPTFLLTHWVGNGVLTPEHAVEMLTGRQSAYLGLADRGRIAPGLRADLNLIDPSRLSLAKPAIVRDLPAGGKRLLQAAGGYVQSWVAGQCVQADGRVTDARPGRLVRMR
ncbi:MAG TPA: amidohydrolase family protein [Burkholderiaceae bacterium]|jgi:N-acyl-D-aspartate/D-glutamate deacylase|nr:amidohydrolase family protein [Burkholderiaceae bacterium]